MLCDRKRGESAQGCEDTIGMLHCVAMCPETSCCAENKCKCVLSHPTSFHSGAVCVYPDVWALFFILQQSFSTARVCLHHSVYSWMYLGVWCPFAWVDTMFLLHVCMCLFWLANFLLSVWNEFIAVSKPLSMDRAVNTASSPVSRSSLTMVLSLCVKGSVHIYMHPVEYVTCYCRIARMNILLHDVLLISGEQYVWSNKPTHIQAHMRVHPQRRQWTVFYCYAIHETKLLTFFFFCY